VGEQHCVGNGYRRIYDLVAIESSVEVLVIEKSSIERHPESGTIWRNIARIISLKLRNASKKASSLSRQLADDTRILHAYTNEYALGRRLKAGSLHQAEYQVDKAIIWFSDIVEFSRHTSKMSPDRIADVVQRFFNAQSLPIISRSGHIDKFMGDGMMAFWVLPQTTNGVGEICIEAIRAAEEAVKAVREISIGNEPLLLRVGLHLGMVVSGDFGSATRHQFTLIGQEVNKAARLEQVRPEEVVEGVSDIGPIRLSHEFRDELSTVLQRRYNRKTVADSKGNEELELFSE
jgi:class 3 adenylate cyclase